MRLPAIVKKSSCEGRKVFEAVNAKTDFDSCRPLEEGGPAAARLGENRDIPSSLRIIDGPMLASASVRKGKKREHCQDAAISFSSRRATLVGVLDGFGNQGTFLSEAVADGLIGDMSFQAKHDPLPSDARGLLVSAVFNALEYFTPPPGREGRGGTTAALALVAPDGAFSAAGIGDSAIYVLRRRGVERLFSSYRLDGYLHPVAGAPLFQYFAERNVLSSAINADGINPKAVDISYGYISPGECLLIVTDGITKSLSVIYDPRTACIRDNSGCRDLRSILRGERNPERVVEKLLKAMEGRIEGSPDDGCFRFVGRNDAMYPVDDDMALIAIGFAR